jgi:16S rRNA (cytosine1402-N4)-methyltransferase
LINEVLASLNPKEGEKYLDLTAGYGGHANKILDVTKNYKDAVLVDRDEFACEHLRLKFSEKSIRLVNDDFYNASLQLVESGKTFDLILGDFGVSSLQLDKAERGFAFTHEGPLDMRMDRRQVLTADRVVNKWSESELVRIFVEYGEESEGMARMVSRKIVTGRPWQTTTQLADAVAAGAYRGKTHPATKVFQAIRIMVNDELGLIERTLKLLPKLLNSGGRVGLISFHSLEDRLVKEYFREMSSFGQESEMGILTKKPIVASKTELVNNPRARSAKLRVAKKL